MSYFAYDHHQIWFECHGEGEPLLLLHGNTASCAMFAPIIPALAAHYQVITMDFLGCGLSEHLPSWPRDLWFEWSKQVAALCSHLGIRRVNIVGASGGALAAINAALEYPQLVHRVAADSFAGTKADPSVTKAIQAGRAAAKQIEGFRAYQQSIHGDDWEAVLDADTQAIICHAGEIGAYFHQPLESLQVRMLLTGSEEDEMFSDGHCRRLFREIGQKTTMAQAHIFPHGGHPAMMSNASGFVQILNRFLCLD